MKLDELCLNAEIHKTIAEAERRILAADGLPKKERNYELFSIGSYVHRRKDELMKTGLYGRDGLESQFNLGERYLYDHVLDKI